MDFEGWVEAMNINTLAPVRVLHALLDNLRESENTKVVNISSELGAISIDRPVG